MSDQFLSPLSISVVAPAIVNAHRHLGATFSLPHSSPNTEELLLWRQISLADIIVQSWQADRELVATLLQISPTVLTARSAGKTSKSIRQAAAFIESASAANKRLRRWSQAVQAMSWSQSQLLQVMEEVEPMISLAVETVEQMAWAAVGSYQLLTKMLSRRFAAGAPKWAADIVQGVVTPDSQQVDDWAQGMAIEVWLERWGHRADFELELSTPRLTELDLAWWPRGNRGMSWNSQQAQNHSRNATEQALAKAGWLHRASLQKQIALTRQALATHGEARDALALTLAATRRWCLAAAAEGKQGDRIHNSDEVFLLELEEIKQMLTGEWHHRRFVEAQISDRAPRLMTPAVTASSPLGIVDAPSVEAAVSLSRPEALSSLQAGSTALAPRTSALWTPFFLQATGVILTESSFLSHGAAVARGGGFPCVLNSR